MNSKAVTSLILALVLLALFESVRSVKRKCLMKRRDEFSFEYGLPDLWKSIGTTSAHENVDRIAGGYYAVEKQFPFMAIIHRLMGGTLFSQCGGTVVSKRWVLTAGHCIAKLPHRFLVVFGVVSKEGISYDKYNGSGVAMISERVIVHPEYSHSTNDIGFLYMPNDIPFTNEIQPIAVIGRSEASATFFDASAYVIGWGKDMQTSWGTKALKYSILPIIMNTECARYWTIDERNICTAPALGTNACQGDSGGPLAVIKNNRILQIGIVSFGDADCPSRRPGVFTRIAAFLPWMEKVTGLKF